MSSPPRPPASAARSRWSGAGRSPGWRLGSNRHHPDVGRGQIEERQDAGTKPGTHEDALVPIADIAAGETVALARDIAERADEREANLPPKGLDGKDRRDGPRHTGHEARNAGWAVGQPRPHQTHHPARRGQSN